MPLMNFAVVESTLREGEQFSGANFSTAQPLSMDELDEALRAWPILIAERA